MEIQKDLATTQIDTFKDALEKSQRVEQARFQVRTFQVKRHGASSSTTGRGDQNVPHPKFGEVGVEFESQEHREELHPEGLPIEGDNRGLSPKEVRHPLLEQAVDIMVRQTTLRMLVGEK